MRIPDIPTIRKASGLLRQEHLPAAVEIEEEMLGILLYDPAQIESVSFLAEPDFYGKYTGHVYGALRYLKAHGHPVNMTTLAHELGVRDVMNGQARGYLASLMDRVGSAETGRAEYYARILRQKALARSAIYEFADLIGKAYSRGEDEISLLEDASARINSMLAKDVSESGQEGPNFDPFPDEVYALLPSDLRDVCIRIEEGYKRDLFLIGFLAVMAGMCPNVLTRYGGHWQALNLFMIVVADASAGKSAVRRARPIGETLNKQLFNESLQARKEWAKKLRLYEKGKLAEDEHPGSQPPLMRFFSADDTSSKAIKESLDQSPHSVIFETEIKTMAAALNSDWGDYRDVLLKSFHNEPISVDRSGQEPLLVERPALSVCITGTPGTFKGVLEDIEDGLFSRTLFYHFYGEPEFKSQFADTAEGDVDRRIRSLSLEMPMLYVKLLRRDEPLYVRVADPEQALVVEAGKRAMNQLIASGADMRLQANIKRAALIAVRIAGLLTIFRLFRDHGEDHFDVRSIEVRPEDMRAGLMLAFHMMDHALGLASLIETDTLGTDVKHKFFSSLPEGSFSTQDAYKSAERFHIPGRTVRDYLSSFCSLGLLRKEDHGSYFKPVQQRVMRSFRRCIQDVALPE